MTKCDKLRELLAEFEADGNTDAAAAIQTAMDAAGCGVTAEDDSGGTGNGPPVRP